MRGVWREDACFCLILHPYRSHTEMGEVPNLTNGTIQVSLPENASLANSCEGCVVLCCVAPGHSGGNAAVQTCYSSLGERTE